VIPATSFRAVLLPDPFRPTIPYVCPGATRNESPSTARNVSRGLRSAITLRCRRALFNVENCRPP
jgi:hypothetical protein